MPLTVHRISSSTRQASKISIFLETITLHTSAIFSTTPYINPAVSDQSGSPSRHKQPPFRPSAQTVLRSRRIRFCCRHHVSVQFRFYVSNAVAIEKLLHPVFFLIVFPSDSHWPQPALKGREFWISGRISFFWLCNCRQHSHHMIVSFSHLGHNLFHTPRLKSYNSHLHAFGKLSQTPLKSPSSTEHLART